MNKVYDNRAGIGMDDMGLRPFTKLPDPPARPISHLEQAIVNLTQLNGPLDNALEILFDRLSPVLRNEEENDAKECPNPRTDWVKHAEDIRSFTDSLERQIKRIQNITSRLEV